MAAPKKKAAGPRVKAVFSKKKLPEKKVAAFMLDRETGEPQAIGKVEESLLKCEDSPSPGWDEAMANAAADMGAPVSIIRPDEWIEKARRKQARDNTIELFYTVANVSHTFTRAFAWFCFGIAALTIASRIGA